MHTIVFCFVALASVGCASKPKPQLEPLKVNRVLSLDGNEDYVEVADSDSLDLVTAITIEMWVQLSLQIHGNRTFIFLNKEDAYECAVSFTPEYLIPQQNFAFAFSIKAWYFFIVRGRSRKKSPSFWTYSFRSTIA